LRLARREEAVTCICGLVLPFVAIQFSKSLLTFCTLAFLEESCRFRVSFRSVAPSWRECLRHPARPRNTFFPAVRKSRKALVSEGSRAAPLPQRGRIASGRRCRSPFRIVSFEQDYAWLLGPRQSQGPSAVELPPRASSRFWGCAPPPRTPPSGRRRHPKVARQCHIDRFASEPRCSVTWIVRGRSEAVASHAEQWRGSVSTAESAVLTLPRDKDGRTARRQIRATVSGGATTQTARP
jgi:hypothetical protein